MDKYYTSERNVQIVLALLKAHGIRKVIASPGTTNITLVASMQQDPFFEMYSSVDERSAAYMACGLAAESGEPVVLSCTGATASRNYMPGLTEAYYRKLPVLAITSTQDASRVGHHCPQVIDRSVVPNDIANLSVTVLTIKDEEDVWTCEIKVNEALLALKRRGGGPVHINLATSYSHDFSIRELPAARRIDRICADDEFPKMPMGNIAIFIGAHSKWDQESAELVDEFCASNNAVVFCDHTSNYQGQYKVPHALVASSGTKSIANDFEILIHIGEVSGDYTSGCIQSKAVWRVNEDGEIRDTFRRLRYVFEMSEKRFFKHYIKDTKSGSNTLLKSFQDQYEQVYNVIPELPFSNLWIAQKTAGRIPINSVVHLGILNTLRSWNMFEFPQSVLSNSNVGGFGIDGDMSSLIGASLSDRNKLFFGIFGDLAFFYDMNVLGNHHVGCNVRIMLINNGRGTEFRNFNHPGAAFGEEADKFIAAAGHYGDKSPLLVRHYAEDLGFEYMCASNKEEFESVYERFLTADLTTQPMLFEVFTNSVEESNALKIIYNIDTNILRSVARQMLGGKGIGIIRKVIKK